METSTEVAARTVLLVEDEERDVEVLSTQPVQVCTLSDFSYVNETSRAFGASLQADLDMIAGLDFGLRPAAFAVVARWLERRRRKYAYLGGDMASEDADAVRSALLEWSARTSSVVTAQWAAAYSSI